MCMLQEAKYLILIEEDLDVALDFFRRVLQIVKGMRSGSGVTIRVEVREGYIWRGRLGNNSDRVGIVCNRMQYKMAVHARYVYDR